MANYRAAIKRAIVAAGLKITEFEVHSTGFEPNWAAVGLAGKRFAGEDQKAINKQNRNLAKVAKALVATGCRVAIYTAAHGGKVCEINEYRHYGHTVDYSNPASVHHY